MSEYMLPQEKPSPTVEEMDNTGTLLEDLFDKPDAVIESNDMVDSKLSKKDLDSAERVGRLMQVKAQLGFYPQGKRELAQAFALSSDTFRNNAGGAAKFLNEVLNRQRKLIDQHQDDDPPFDPSAALRSILSEWENNVKSSRWALTALDFLTEEIAASGPVNQRAGLGNLSRIRDWRQQDWTRRAIAVMTRNHETKEFIINAADESLDVNYESSEAEVLQREADYLKTMRVGDAKKSIVNLKADHTNRMHFWLDRISEARSHYSVGAQASQIIEKYRKNN